MFLFLWSSIANTIGNGLQMVKMVIMMVIEAFIIPWSRSLWWQDRPRAPGGEGEDGRQGGETRPGARSQASLFNGGVKYLLGLVF